MTDIVETGKKSKSGKDKVTVKLPVLEGVKNTFSSGNEGFSLYGTTVLDGKVYRVTGNLIEQ